MAGLAGSASILRRISSFPGTASEPSTTGSITENWGIEKAHKVDAFCVAGLIGGIASYFAGTAQVTGAEPDGAPTLTRARAAGAPADAPAGSIAVDALAPRRVGELVFPITQHHVEDVVLVDDASILAAQRALWRALRIAAEPAACVGIAALLSGGYKPAPGENVAVVLSGANMVPSQLG